MAVGSVPFDSVSLLHSDMRYDFSYWALAHSVMFECRKGQETDGLTERAWRARTCTCGPDARGWSMIVSVMFCLVSYFV